MNNIRRFTKEEFLEIEKLAIDTFKQLIDESLENYSKYLEDLLKQDIDNFRKTKQAFSKQQWFYNTLGVYIQENYDPKSIIDDAGFVYFTIDSAIFATLSSCLSKSDIEYQQLYLDFHEKIFPEYEAPII